MNSRSSQPLVWIIVTLLTVALYAAALNWVHFRIPLKETPPIKTELIDLNIIEFTPPQEEVIPAPAPLPQPEPQAEPEPTSEPEPAPKVLPPQAEPELIPDLVEPPAAAESQADPDLLRQEQEAQQEARAKELQRQRELATQRAERKRQQQLAAKKRAAAAKASKARAEAAAAAQKEKAQAKAAAQAKIAARAKATARAKAAAQAKAAAAKRIVTKPAALSRPSPKYPSSARRSGHEGTVKLSFTVSSSGRVSSVRVSQSSGHSSLDRAALSAIRKWRFKPARNGLGQAVSYHYTLPIPFRLR